MFKDQENIIQYVMSRDVAIQELNKWFDTLRVPVQDRIDFEEEAEEFDIDGYEEPKSKKSKEKKDVMRENVIKAFRVGRLIQNDEGELVYKLRTPLKKKESKEIVLSELTFLTRYRAYDLEQNMKGVEGTDIIPMTTAYIATLTNKPRGLIRKMFNTDYEICQAIYLLFTRGDA